MRRTASARRTEPGPPGVNRSGGLIRCSGEGDGEGARGRAYGRVDLRRVHRVGVASKRSRAFLLAPSVRFVGRRVGAAHTGATGRPCGHGTREAPDPPRRGTGSGQDLRDAVRGPPSRAAGHGLRGGFRRAPRPAAQLTVRAARGDQGSVRLDPGADPGAVRPALLGREGRGARRGRRRLRHQALRHGRAAGSAAGRRPSCRTRGRGGVGGPGRDRRAHRRPGRQEGRPERQGRKAHAHRVASAGGAGARHRPHGRPEATAPGGVGPVVRDGDELPAGLHGAAAQEAGGGSIASPALHHGAGDGVPIREVGHSRSGRGAKGEGGCRNAGTGPGVPPGTLQI